MATNKNKYKSFSETKEKQILEYKLHKQTLDHFTSDLLQF